VAGEILSCVLPLAVLEVRGLHQDPRAVALCALAVRMCVLHAHEYRVRRFALAGRTAVAADVGHDHGAVAERELRPVVLADPDALDEAERLREPRDRLPHVGVDQGRGRPWRTGSSGSSSCHFLPHERDHALAEELELAQRVGEGPHEDSLHACVGEGSQPLGAELGRADRQVQRAERLDRGG
jgi:hypothetical protein